MDMAAFFKLHQGLTREGPGEARDVAWACYMAGVAHDARIMDAGAGPGADIASLLQAAPKGHVLAVDGHAGFVDQINATYGDDPRVTALTGDMMAQPGPFDLIWSAGAAYFPGLAAALTGWRDVLRADGVVALSYPALFRVEAKEAATAFFGGFVAPLEDEIAQTVADAGYALLGQSRVRSEGWDAYFQPLDRRIADLRAEAQQDAALAAVLDEAVEEAARWRAGRDDFGYALVVARKKDLSK